MPSFTCIQTTKLDLFPKIGHSNSSILRKIASEVTEEELPTPITGGRVLESLGGDNREMLMVAHDKLGIDIYVEEWLREDGNEKSQKGILASFYEEYVHHKGRKLEDHGLINNHVYVDICDYPIEEIDNELRKRIQEAETHGLSEEGTEKLKQIIQKDTPVFKIQLGTGAPPRVTPMKIAMDESKKPVKVKVHKKPADQRRFLDTFFYTLVKQDS